MADLDRLLSPDVSRVAAEAVTPLDFARVQERGLRRRRRTALLTSAAVTAFVVVGVTAVLRFPDRENGRTTPLNRPTASPTPTLVRPAQVRPASVLRGLPIVGSFERDPSDAALGGIDIVSVQGTHAPGLIWVLTLRTPPPSEQPAGVWRVIEYGIVLDTDGDRVADCEFGIGDAPVGRDRHDLPPEGEWRVWATNFRTGERREKVGPGYGWPVEFSHPLESGSPGHKTMKFIFLGGTVPCGQVQEDALFYAWSSVSLDGRVTERDFAPDAAWMRIPHLSTG